jgi:uncharacterized protein
MSLETVRLGRTNLKVTRLGFGGIPIQRLNEEDAVAVVKKCVELGITYLDTANGYTTSEQRIGKAIAGKREKLVIATKSMPVSPEVVKKNLHLSLERLKTDYIDIYQFHGVSTMKALDAVLDPGPAGMMATVKEAKKAGLIRHISITSHQIDVAKKAVQSDQFETIMFPFNFLSPEVAETLLPLCKEHDVGFICMKPLAGGMVDNATICFKYLLQFPEIVAIPGIEKISEIEEIHQIYQKPAKMTQAELRQMEEIKKELGTSFCHRCDYCQPCTAEIPISMIMTTKSFFKRSPPERFFGEMTTPAMQKAAACTRCGNCEERCPYHLPIRDRIAEQVEWYNTEKKKYLESCKK